MLGTPLGRLLGGVEGLSLGPAVEASMIGVSVGEFVAAGGSSVPASGVSMGSIMLQSTSSTMLYPLPLPLSPSPPLLPLLPPLLPLLPPHPSTL